MINWFLFCVKDNYMNFNGRGSRSEFWYFMLVYVLVAFIVGFIGGFLGSLLKSETITSLFSIISIVYSLGLLLPYIGAAARRLHDIGKSGWMLLVGFIPIIGAIYLIYLLVQPSQEEANEYGEAAPQAF